MPAWYAYPAHSQRLNLDLATFRDWLEHGGSREYEHFLTAWAIEADEAASRQQAEWVQHAPAGRRRAVLRAEAS